jgi:hypothetical protein
LEQKHKWNLPDDGRNNMTDVIRHFDTDDLIMSTTAYYLGRRTASVGDFCQRLRKAWPELNEDVRAYVRRIVESAFLQEEILLRLRPDSSPFGHACDRDEWVAVRGLWATETEVKK